MASGKTLSQTWVIPALVGGAGDSPPAARGVSSRCPFYRFYYTDLQFIKDVHDMMMSKMYKLKNGALSSDDMAGQITLEKNGRFLDFSPGRVSGYGICSFALSEADGIDYTVPEELELVVATLMDLDAMDGKGSVSLLAECSRSPDVSTRYVPWNSGYVEH